MTDSADAGMLEVDGRLVDVDQAEREFHAAMARPAPDSLSVANDPTWPRKNIPAHKPGTNHNYHDQLFAHVWNACLDRALLPHGCGDNAKRCDGRGFPDMVIAGPNGTVFVELKVTTMSDYSPYQKAWGHMLLAGGEDYRVWYWADWKSGSIGSQLDDLCQDG